MNFKKTVLSATVAAALAMGVAGQASAYVYAGASLSVDALSISIVPTVAVSINRFDFNLTNTAALNNVASISTASCGGTLGSSTCSSSTPALDAAAVNATGSSTNRANNASTGGQFTFFGPPTTTTGNFSNSDSVINAAELVQIGSPTSTREIAESLITTASNAAASAQIQSITGFTLSFTIVGGPASLTLNFLADPDLRAQIFGEGAGTYSAQANLNTSFTLSQNTGTGPLGFVNWNPQGTAQNDCLSVGGPTCVETADTQDLNVNVGTTANNTVNDSSWDPNLLTQTAFGIAIANLGAGTYTLTLNEVVSTQLARTPTVPEPGTLALMGLALMGVVATTRRKNRS